MKDGAPKLATAQRKGELSPAELEERSRQVVEIADELFRHTPDWVVFFNEILGVHGVVRKLYPEVEDMVHFERSPANAHVQRLLTRLRERPSREKEKKTAPQRMLTVRMPAPLYEALTEEAGKRNLSLNKLCITKLLRMLDQQAVPVTGPPKRPRPAKRRTTISKPK